MKIERFDLIGSVQTGVDRLNNPIYEEKDLGHAFGRWTEWNAEDTGTIGRDYTMSARKVLLRMPRGIDIATKIRNKGDTYEIDKMIDLNGRFMMLYVKGAFK